MVRILMRDDNRIEDYFVIGDLHSAALISSRASIDWLCLPHFDSPSLFAKLIDQNAGNFSVGTQTFKVNSRYIKETAIVEFEFVSNLSKFLVHDYMVPMPHIQCENHFLIRKFIGIKGKSEIKLFFKPQPEYALKQPDYSFDSKKLVLKAEANGDILLIYLPKKAFVVKTKQQGYEISFGLSEKEQAKVAMEYIMEGCESIYNNQDLEESVIKFWHDWVAKGDFFEFGRDKLIRSAITLKLMQFYPTGAIIAAPTTSLPESIGGGRNWDYRYVWIRDATFTLYALYVLGYVEEAESFFNFIERITQKYATKDFDISLIYTIEGKPVPDEKTLTHLSGYKYSQPVRIGNRAKEQFQLDVYGSLIDAYYFTAKRGYEIDDKHKKIILSLAKKIKKKWLKKDNGIWEMRKKKEHFVYSKVMAWVGINRILRMSGKLKLTPSKKHKFENLEKDISDWIWQNCFDYNSKTFKQHPNTNYQDATNLLFVLLQFLDKHQPLTKSIINQTEKELSFNEVFVYRYFSSDGLQGTEGAFLLCSFWLISALAIIEETGKAVYLFSKLEKYISVSGLMSEEIDPNTGEYLGNFPQAFSHLGYIMSAYYLHKYALNR